MALNNPYALSFDGVDDYIQFNQRVIPTGAFSVAFTLQKTGSTDQITEEIFNTSYAQTSDYGVRCWSRCWSYPSGEVVFCGTAAQSGWNFYLTSGRELNYDEPHDVLCVWDGTTASGGVLLYVDDFITPVATGKAAVANNRNHTYNLRIGRQVQDSEGRFLKGILDNFSVWNRVLSSAERLALKNRYIKNNEEGLLALYRFDEGFSNTAYDHSGNGNHGIIYGATWVPGIVDLELGYIDVTTIMPIEVKYNSMTLKGNLRGLGDYPQAECYFQYTTDPNFETGIIETPHQVKTAPGEFEQQITGLDNSKTYYYRAVATGIDL